MPEKFPIVKNESNQGAEQEGSICDLLDQLSNSKKILLEKRAFSYGSPDLEGGFTFFEKENPGNKSLAILLKEFNEILDDSEVGYYVGKYDDPNSFDFKPTRKIDKTEFDNYVNQDESEIVYEVSKNRGNSRVMQLVNAIFDVLH